jgi:hypothetical protein
MKFKLFRQHGALNSPQIFNAFETGLKNAGHTVVESDEDVCVIWSVLWHGRMAGNHPIYKTCVKQNKPIIIIEVGNLIRNNTWRICLNHINGLGVFGNDKNLDEDRPNKLGIKLQPYNENRKKRILIATQHSKSLQWVDMPPIDKWVSNLVTTLQSKIDIPIYIRPHPRSPLTGLQHEFNNVFMQQPNKIRGSYDDFDIDYNYHVVINHNSGVPIHAAIAGTPVICDTSSLAHEVSCTLDDIQKPYLPERENWLTKLTHTEWTVEEISKGIPIKRLEESIDHQLNT